MSEVMDVFTLDSEDGVADKQSVIVRKQSLLVHWLFDQLQMNISVFLTPP